MIVLENVSCFLGGRKIIDNVSFNVNRGDILLLFGANGAGKTTLMKILTGIITDYQGEVKIDKQSIKGLSRKELAQKFSYIQQSEEFTIPVTVHEILKAGRYPYSSIFRGLSKDDFSIIEEGIELFKLEEMLKRDIRTLSGGEKKRVMLASAYIQDVSVILYDEPYTFLDPKASSELTATIKRLQKRERTQIIISHNLEQLYPIINSMAAIRKGRVIYSGPKKFDASIFRETYDMEFELLRTEDNRELLIPNE